MVVTSVYDWSCLYIVHFKTILYLLVCAWKYLDSGLAYYILYRQLTNQRFFILVAKSPLILICNHNISFHQKICKSSFVVKLRNLANFNKGLALQNWINVSISLSKSNLNVICTSNQLKFWRNYWIIHASLQFSIIT